ncbi:MAG TPA: outer membrane beta-barrel protein, partial [Myxococcaceae bacterium]|nr:outer membrane beta-barrel protein [Myxococcaceae bacterium]
MSREGRRSESFAPSALRWVAAASVFALALPARAQVAGDNGIKVGDGRLHPFFDLEGAYDSAAGFFGTAGGNAVLSGEIVTHFRPGLRLEMPSNLVNLNLGGDIDYVYYTGLISPGSSAASHLEASANLEADFNKAGAVEFEIGDNFSRLDRTTNVALGVGILSLYNEAHASLPIHPGGGALEITPKGSVSFEQYTPLSTITVAGCTDPSCNPALVSNFNYLDLNGGLSGLWRFLPKTALSIDATYDARGYQNDPHSAQLLHGYLGLVGLVTAKLAVVAKAGWAQDFAGSNAKTVVGQAEVNYLLSDTSNIKAGYFRDLSPVPEYGMFGDDRVYAEAKFFLGGRLTLRAYGAFDNLTFYGTPARTDQVVTVDAGPAYQFTRWLIAAAGYTLNY